MKLYDGGRAPNPRRVRIFLAEKGISVPLEPVDIAAKAHLSEAFTALNPLQRLPVLLLDDGTAIAESIAICRYFEALHPEPSLFGRDAKSSALIEMWQRRLELSLYLPVQAVFRHLHPAMKDFEIPQIPAWGDANKPRVMDFLALLDRELAGRRYIAGDEFSVADITGLVTLDFFKPAKMTVPPEFTHVVRWHNELAARPSAGA
jgi:glutathione S-transferase